MKGFFIIGTDTDVGKTMATACLLKGMHEQNIDAVALKPIQTGCEKTSFGLSIPDIEVYKQSVPAVYKKENLEQFGSYFFEPACSPHLAAKQGKVEIDLNKIVEKLTSFSTKYDCLLVEGAGGLLVPLNKQETLLDLVKLLKLPIILVVGNKLGCVNHALLTLNELKRSNLKVAGIIYTNLKEEDESFITNDNPKVIQEFFPIDNRINLPIVPKTASNDWDWSAVSDALLPFIKKLRKEI